MRAVGTRALRFTRIRLENWRNFAECEVSLQRRAFLIGPNASGKSNFLDVFRFLRDISIAGGGFSAAVRDRDGVSNLRCFAARRYSDILVRVQVGSDDDPSIWEYEVQFTQDNQQRPILKRERVTRQETVLLDRPGKEDREDPERLTQTYLEQVTVNKEFRELAEFFSSVRYLHLVPQLVREPDRSVGKINDPFGGDFLEQVARTPEKTRQARLRRIQEVLQVAVPQLEQLEMQRDVRGVPHLRGKYRHWRPQGAWLTERRLSDGTLRLLGLLWAALDGSGPLLLEEPELSLHPEVVLRIPQMFARMQRKSGRQILVSTHSLELLRDEGIGLDEVILLQPTDEGTAAHLAENYPEIRELLAGGSSLAEATMPYSRPDRAEQLVLFPD
jgi:predicted ATPase